MSTVSARPQPKKKLSIEQLVDGRKTIYVRNLVKNGIVSLQFPDPGGRRATRVIIPRTKHPYNLSDYVQPQSIQASSDLRLAIARGAIELVDPDVAERELAKPSVLAELRAAVDRISDNSKEISAYKSKRDETEPGSVIAYNGNTAIPLVMPGGGGVDARSEIENADSPEEDLDTINGVRELRKASTSNYNTRLCHNLSMLFEGEMSGREVRTDLSTLLEDLTDEDLEFAIQQCSGTVEEKLAKDTALVREWAENVLSERRGTGVIPGYEE